MIDIFFNYFFVSVKDYFSNKNLYLGNSFFIKINVKFIFNYKFIITITKIS